MLIKQKRARDYLEKNALALLLRVEECTDDSKRLFLLNDFARQKNSDRVLIDLFSFSYADSLQFEIIEALGFSSSERSLEFLIDLVIFENDLCLVKKSLHALAQQDSAQVNVFLSNMIKKEDFSLKREALMLLNKKGIKEPLLAEKIDFDGLLNVCLAQGMKVQTKIEAINKMVWQTKTAPFKENYAQCERAFLKVLSDHKIDRFLAERVLRALAQLRSCHADFYTYIKQELGKEDSEWVLPILGKAQTLEAEKILTSLLKEKTKRLSFQIKAVQALSAFTKISDTSILEKISPALQKAADISLLKIFLVKPFVADLLIEEKLKSGNVYRKVLALSCARQLKDKRLLPKIKPFVQHQTKAIAQRAFAVSCEGGDDSLLTELFHFACEKAHKDESFFLKNFIFYVHIVPTEKYPNLILAIRQKLEDWAAVKEIKESFLDLLDLLYFQSISAKEKLHLHIDQSLEASLPAFYHLSLPVQAVLRNAELIWNETEKIKDIDHSTVIISYNKAIDILLQEKLGSLLFNSHEKWLRRLQSNIVGLDLENERLTVAEILRKLCCEEYFSVDNFPRHKLFLIMHAISTGRFKVDQQRLIDGLRAWSIVLLLFMQPLYKDKEPILQLPKITTRKMLTLAKMLNEMQEARNSAAHRGVFFDRDLLTEVRRKGLVLLREIDALFTESR